MKDVSGKKNPFYGRKHSKESIQKMREAKLGKKNVRYGVHLSDETKKKIGDAQLGEKNHMFGKHRTEKWKKQHSKRMTGKNNPMYGISINGDKSPHWRGDFVSYEGLHIWVKKNKPKPELCEMCNKRKPKHISNISGEYKRDVNDYQWLCVPCHSNYDKQIREPVELM